MSCCISSKCQISLFWEGTLQPFAVVLLLKSWHNGCRFSIPNISHVFMERHIGENQGSCLSRGRRFSVQKLMIKLTRHWPPIERGECVYYPLQKLRKWPLSSTLFFLFECKCCFDLAFFWSGWPLLSVVGEGAFFHPHSVNCVFFVVFPAAEIGDRGSLLWFLGSGAFFGAVHRCNVSF